MMPLNHILRKCTTGYKRNKSQEKIISPNVHGRHQTVYQKCNRIGNSNTNSQNIQSEYRDGIWHRKRRHTINEKRQTTLYGWN